MITAMKVTVNGKDYVADGPHRVPGGGGEFCSYRAVRGGKPFGPTRTTSTSSRPGSVGAEIMAAVLAADGGTIGEQSRVMLAGDGRTRIGTVVALDNLPPYASQVMVMWDTDRDGSVNAGGKAYWYPISRVELAP